MTHDSQLLRLDPNGGDTTDLLATPGTGPRGMSAQASQMPNPVARIRSIMHGRWKYAIPLALACAAAGAYLGYISKVPKYRSSAEILFSPVRISSGEGLQMMVGFQDFVASQCIIIHSQQEINLAMQQTPWVNIGKGNTDEMVSEYSKKLNIDHLSGHVTIEYIDEDPKVAIAAIQATMAAYHKVYSDTDPEHTHDQLKLLESQKSDLETNRQAVNHDIQKLCGEFVDSKTGMVAPTPFTAETLVQYYTEKMATFIKTETSMVSTKMDLDAMRVRLTNAGVIIPAELAMDDEPEMPQPTTNPAIATGTQPATQPVQTVQSPPPPQLTPEIVAQSDPIMAALLRQRMVGETNLESDAKVFAPNHKTIISDKAAIAKVDIEINKYMQTVKPASVAVKNGGDPRIAELATLLQTYRQLKMLVASTRNESTDLVKKINTLKTDQELDESYKKRIAAIDARYVQLNNEYQLANRAQFLSEGDKDFYPFEDKRKTMATFGGTLGAALGFGSIFLLGLLDRRVKTIADAKQTFRRNRRVLGILPTLPDNLGDPRQAAFAAHCVHHVRNLLQLGMSPDRGAVMAVTSASPGEGKTSLTLSLGLSFAAANSRTLMIDCDVVGGGLTARVNAIIRRKMGDVLKRQGRITEQQLTMALQMATHKNIRLGEALVELGFLSAQDIDQALSAQKESLIGLLDVLDGEPLNTCITQAGSPNLFVLPRGMAVASNSGQVSAKAIRRIIAEARAQYDVVLIDTGPVLGSLEASIVASEADGVVLAVSRGQQKTLAERAMELLDSIGANIAGIVFNRAQTDDMDTIQYSSSIPANALQSVPHQTAGDGTSSRLGPVAYAVASATNQSTAHRTPGAPVNGHVNGKAPARADAPAHPQDQDA